MFIRKLKLRNFRCFDECEYSFDDRLIIIEGRNGAGKSSLLEALHYACYLKSFRTSSNNDLVKIGKDFFFVEIDVGDEVCDKIQVGFDAEQGKIVKFNQKSVISYRDLLLQYRIVTLCADDVMMVCGTPEYRRNFLNHSLLLLEPSRYSLFKKYKQIADQRKSLLFQIQHAGIQRKDFCDQLLVWTEKLWSISLQIKKLRVEYLKELEDNVNQLLAEYFCVTDTAFQIKLNYISKNIDDVEDFEKFWSNFYERYYSSEIETGRCFFGAHQDDFSIEFYGKKARIFASRGQQKLIMFLLKISQLNLMNICGKSGVLLLDDFVTDFDKQNISSGFSLLNNWGVQVFLTTPNSVCNFCPQKSTTIYI